jgi:transaldolase
LIGPDTVNTIPVATLDAFRDHGHVRGDTITLTLTEARESLDVLSRLGIDLDAIAEKLQVDGISAFAADYDRVLAALDKKRVSRAATGAGRQTFVHGS